MRRGLYLIRVSPVHTLDTWLTLAKQLESMGSDSICIKDMAGLLKPYDAYEMVERLKKRNLITHSLACPCNHWSVHTYCG